MRNGEKWVVVDTETDGFHEPVHVIEIAAQVMEGWSPAGPPFRVLINHGIQIDRQAQAIHGYSSEFLRSNGISPLEAHQMFARYVQGCPIVSHNLAFDWDRALFAEWKRLGLPVIGRRGFCSLMLSRRIIPEVESHGLDVLKQAFGLESNVSHKAYNDVATLVELLRTTIAPRLQKLSLDTYEMVEAFSVLEMKKTREVMKSTFGADLIKNGTKPRHDAEPVFSGTVYHVARNGVILGEYLLLGLYNGIRGGELNADDHYWTQGMGESWARLSDITHLINSAAPKMASPQQAAYLSWLGILDAESLTAKEASDKIQKIGGNITLREDGKNWTTERYILHPHLFKEELAKHINGKIKKECLAFYDSKVFESSRYPDADVVNAVIQSLFDDSPNWWAQENFRQSFYEKVKLLYPACCDGKSVYYEHELPVVLHQYVRMILVGCSEKLTKAKIRDVMKSLSSSDAEWFTKEGFEEIFLGELKVSYPGCCDGGDRFEIARARRASEISELSSKISKVLAKLHLASGLSKNDKHDLGLLYFDLAARTELHDDIKNAFDWMSAAACAGSISAARFMINFRPEMYGYNPPLVELRTWISFVNKYDGHVTGLSDLAQLGTPQALSILSIFDNLGPSSLAGIEQLMTREQLTESDNLLAQLAEKRSDFIDDSTPS